jgi:nicotinate phosphoribosyltransferase
MTGQATFSLFVRQLPTDRGFLVAAGLDDCLAFLETLRFSPDDLAYLRAVPGFAERDLDAFARLRFSGDVWAVPEGRVVFADEPILEVTAPLAEAQLVETYLLNQVSFQTAIASKAARVRLAAGDRPVVDFSFRRTQGPEAAIAVARACAIVGFAGTSNVEAARRFGLTPVGTMAHSYVQAFESEAEAFEAFAADFPTATTLLVDTYDTLDGVATAARLIGERGLGGNVGIRLDSGDLATLAREARRLLDDAGLQEVRIMASGSLDEYAIVELVAAGAPIDAFGVGTKMGVSADAPYLDSVYKLVAYAGRPVMKLSPAKATEPGRKQVFRRMPIDGDVVGLRDEDPPPDTLPLLESAMVGGRRVPSAGLAAARERFERDLEALPGAARRIVGPVAPNVHRSARLRDLGQETARALTGARTGAGRREAVPSGANRTTGRRRT